MARISYKDAYDNESVIAQIAKLADDCESATDVSTQASADAAAAVATAASAESKAAAAVTTANAASATAEGIADTADSALIKADAAYINATAAFDKVTTAQNRADDAYALASTANTTANTADSRAKTAANGVTDLDDRMDAVEAKMPKLLMLELNDDRSLTVTLEAQDNTKMGGTTDPMPETSYEGVDCIVTADSGTANLKTISLLYSSGLMLDSTTKALRASVDGNTIKVNAAGQLVATGGGSGGGSPGYMPIAAFSDRTWAAGDILLCKITVESSDRYFTGVITNITTDSTTGSETWTIHFDGYIRYVAPVTGYMTMYLISHDDSFGGLNLSDTNTIGNAGKIGHIIAFSTDAHPAFSDWDQSDTTITVYGCIPESTS